MELRSILTVSAALFVGPSLSLAQAPERAHAPQRVLTAMSTPLSSGHPLQVIASSPKPIQFFESQAYSKLSVLFEQPVRIDEVHIESCDSNKPFEDGVELFLGLDDARIYSDGGKAKLKFTLPRRRALNEVRSLTLGFLQSKGLCLKSVGFYTNGKPTELMIPEILQSSGSTELGDGRIDFNQTGSISDHVKKSGKVGTKLQSNLQLNWDRDLIVESLRMWNGNQAAGDSYLASPRGRKIEFSNLDEKGKEFGGRLEWNLEDRRGVQTFDLPAPVATRGLKFNVIDVFPGMKGADFDGKISRHFFSELQIMAAGTVWVPGVIDAAAEKSPTALAAQARLESMKKLGLDELLDRELRSDNDGKANMGLPTWRFRFRSDGTVTAMVFTERARMAKTWTLIGSWIPIPLSDLPVAPVEKLQAESTLNASIKTDVASAENSSATNSLALTNSAKKERSGRRLLRLRDHSEPVVGFALKIVGARYATSDFFDSLSCGNLCFSAIGDRGPANARELPVNEYLEIHQGPTKRQFYIRNRSLRESRTLDFSDLKMRAQTLAD